MDDEHDLLRRAAAEHGFDLVGVTSAAPLEEALVRLEAWAAQGHAADLGYMVRNPPERADPRTLMREVRSVVSVAVPYHAPAPDFASEGRYGRVARYAWGLDYHDLMLPRLRALAETLREALGGRRARAACDHSPLLERAVAERAGLGFFGKNTCLLLPRGGSFTLLGEVLLDVELPPTRPAGTDHCGTCRACLDACPTDAFPGPFELDARRCISYLTIEQRGPIDRALRPRLGAWLFGCDVCQDVCPFNRFAPPPPWPELAPEAGVGPRVDLGEVLALEDEAAFRARFAGTPLLRPGRAGLLRNAAVVARNVGAVRATEVLARRAAEDADALVRQHALWALCGLDRQGGRTLAEQRRRVDPEAAVRAEAAACLAEVA